MGLGEWIGYLITEVLVLLEGTFGGYVEVSNATGDGDIGISLLDSGAAVSSYWANIAGSMANLGALLMSSLSVSSL